MAAEQRRARGVDGAHVGVVVGVAVLVEDAREELDDLGGREVRVGHALLAERGLVARAAADAAERSAAVGGIDGHLVGQASQPDLQCA